MQPNTSDIPKYTANPNISPCVVSPPKRVRPWKPKPRQPYAGIIDARITNITRTLRFDHPNLRCRTGHRSEPRIPDVGVSTPIRISADGDMCRVVLPNSMAVDVIVVKPANM